MREVRFFEDMPQTGVRRLLLGIRDYDVNWAVDGGRRELVRPATTADTARYGAAYYEYAKQFEQQAPSPGAQPEQIPA